jgi:DNA-directed RNA polymerase subunit L
VNVVKLNVIEELIGLLNSLSFAIRRSELAKAGKWRAINPITGSEVEISITSEEMTKVVTDLANALKVVSDKIKSIDWSKVE